MEEREVEVAHASRRKQLDSLIHFSHAQVARTTNVARQTALPPIHEPAVKAKQFNWQAIRLLLQSIATFSPSLFTHFDQLCYVALCYWTLYLSYGVCAIQNTATVIRLGTKKRFIQ